ILKKGVNHERAHSDLGKVRSSHQRPRLSSPARFDGADLPGLRLPEMVRIRGAGPDSVYQQRAADLLDVPSFRRPRSQLVSRRFRMGVRHAAIPWILEQATGAESDVE